MIDLFKKVNPFNFLINMWFTQKEPISLVHFVTNRCNARCSFCFIDFDNEDIFKNELSLDEINLLTKNLGKSIVNINFTGGEPFARKDLIDIAECYCKNTSIQSIYITTNGSLPERVQYFAKTITRKYPHVTLSISISIDDLPKNHDRIRKIEGLFDKCILTYNLIKKIKNVVPVVQVTVSDANFMNVKYIYKKLVNDYEIKSLKAIIVRDEGIYKTPNKKRIQILNSYKWITNKIIQDSKNKIISNYDQSSAQGRLHYKKDTLMYNFISKYYLKPFYQSPCPAGKLFGIIDAKGKIFACEILEEDCIGDLRENNMNFMKIWNNQKNLKLRKFIKESKCHCSYECALAFNFTSNFRYQFSFLKSYFDF
ncbi:MAG: 7-carboxy-7-deazaguanine synthase [Alphaproteobacteria bacterium MarineAlpha5_Bin5]|nr:MAG: 7-carboxy-7-deazaguanine synthase [Alphaproteobacteria bacterium MarineAlpha5_Bin4]PPR49541.1 MAG: 7-carboxy-7-deazaguanine synthase [Alphaproteobacteria bacterium MarineAlpha5_Bin5]|tara:strand:+ start:1342 stop:2445 length:1104 start_codon:yes stop_codon:yes gene_type:complete